MKKEDIPSPSFVLEEEKFRKNLSLICSVKERAGIDIIMAFKAFALWKVFDVVREYIPYTTASSLSEARLAYEEMKSYAHTYAPVYSDNEFTQIMECSSHITFNSLGQFTRFGAQALLRGISCGLRINPEYSPVETDLYNPCVAGSRLGIRANELQELPAGIEGLHFHVLCESRPEHLRLALEAVEKHFGHLLPQIKWLNMGGGHLMTHKDYDCDELISVLNDFRSRHPHLRLILEPGSAFTWRTGYLVSTVEDVIQSGGVNTAMLDVSFACHMPDCLEMPYKPAIIGAHDPAENERKWRMGGNSCLAGDFYGDWSFDKDPKVGDRIIFEDMIHYTMVKTTMFNGVEHPSIAIWHEDDSFDIVRTFGYEDYRDRMS